MKKNIRKIVLEIEKERKIIGSSRDRLRELYDEIGELLDVSEEGIELLEQAIDSLSEYV